MDDDLTLIEVLAGEVVNVEPCFEITEAGLEYLAECGARDDAGATP